MQHVHIGTCSWKYSSWEHLVYQLQSERSYLYQYAQTYDTVEIDQWFWSLGRNSYGLPDMKVVKEYDEDTPESFRFTIKCPNALTLPFAYRSTDERNRWFLDSEVMYRFLDRLSPIATKVGSLMFQFGYLNKQMFPDKQAFFDLLMQFFSTLPDSFDYAVELRNPAWLDQTWFDLLAEHTISPVLLYGYWMEHTTDILAQYGNLMHSPLVVRLHGDDRAFIEQKTSEQWNKIVLPKRGELMHIAPQLVRLAKMGKVVYVNVNNHYEGSAPLTIETLLSLIDAAEKSLYE